ncbi:MAG: hypothetical protein H5U07_08395 [Candidatus Aminicenantes bacterium]|nr:hypothetical protein [Candidatus Aminicenantes bacterium]
MEKEEKRHNLKGRRKFLYQVGQCALLAAGYSCFAPLKVQASNFALFDPLARNTRKAGKVRLLFALHRLKQDQPDWPNVGFDFEPIIKKYMEILKKRIPEYDFLVSLASDPEETSKIIENDKDNNIIGYIVFQLNCWNRVLQPAVETGLPVLYVDFQYGGSGGFLVYTASYLRQNVGNFGFIPSSNPAHLIEAARCFLKLGRGGKQVNFSSLVKEVRVKNTPARTQTLIFPDYLELISAEETIEKMKQTRLLLFRDDKGGETSEIAGIKVLNLPFSLLNEAWRQANRQEAEEIARGWWLRASLVHQVRFSELVNSAAMYLGMRKLLHDYQAMGITINCLGGFYGGHIHAYPCLGFHELNNQGLVGACEADVRSAVTMITFNLMTGGRPGYISDPVIDVARRQIIYAHCVASNRVFGPEGPANPVEILTHSEDRQGASVRSIMPAGYLTTSLEMDAGRKQILMHQAVAVGNSFDDRACRTKLVAEPVGDLEKLFTFWDLWGWHRVTFYGDLKAAVYQLAEKMGWEVVEEA